MPKASSKWMLKYRNPANAQIAANGLTKARERGGGDLPEDGGK
jgi:hypothetical protein